MMGRGAEMECCARHGVCTATIGTFKSRRPLGLWFLFVFDENHPVALANFLALCPSLTPVMIRHNTAAWRGAVRLRGCFRA